MNRTLLGLLVSLLALPACADLHPLPTTPRAVADPANVLDDRGAKLEVYPMRRATAQLSTTTRTVVHRVIRAQATDTIGPQQLGVVFNYAMQQQGYITGEIAFKLKAGRSAEDFNAALYPGMKEIILASGVYVVNTTTPAEFMAVMKRLQGNASVEWVEPTVQYGPADGANTTPATPAAQ
jgi:hypothetical protein